MSAAPSIDAGEAMHQAKLTAATYLARAINIVRDDLLPPQVSGRTADLEVVQQFPQLICTLIDAQANDYRSWVLADRLTAIDDSLSSCLAGIAGQMEDSIPGLCLKCSREGMRALRAEMVGDDGE